MAKLASNLTSTLVASFFAATTVIASTAAPATAAPHWGEFRDDGIQTITVEGKQVKVRVYQSVLWGIPWGESWEATCAKTPATVGGLNFSSPTACVKSSVAQPIGAISTGLGAIGLGWTPAGLIGAGGAAVATYLDLSGQGALNMWGVFYVPQKEQTNLYIRPFNNKKFGAYTAQKFAADNKWRGWSWDGTTASYLALNDSGTITLYVRPFDGKNFGPVTSKQQVAKRDTWRGWSWDGTTASYLALNGSGRTILYKRSFDGKNFGPVVSKQQVAKGDNWRGWSWDGTTASYIALDGRGHTMLYTRPFDGTTFGNFSSQQLTKRDNWLGWSWNDGKASYIAH